MGTVLVGGIIVLLVTLAVRSMIRDKKMGKSCQCGSDCSGCKGCH
ncbi:MAG: FeoB-associated Cys-rich membrane protein [Lachnospiraceae bacterium]|nr:FeoB-associated Cys-rich membrane protein [Lachnospiraceae bacterium]